MRRKLSQIAAILAVLLLAGAAALPAQDAEGMPDPDVRADSLATLIRTNAANAGNSLSEAEVDSLVNLTLAALEASEAADSTDATEVDEPSIPTASAGIHPIFRSETKAIDTRIDITNEMTLAVAYPSTWAVGGAIHYNRSLPRELTREGVDTGFSLNTGKQLFEKVPLSLSADRNYRKDEQNKGEDNYRRDVNKLEKVGLGLSGGRRLSGWLAANASTSVGMSDQTIKNNQNLDRSTSNLNRALAGHIDLMPIKGLKVVTGYSGSLVDSDSRLNTLAGNIETRSDSLQFKVDYRPSAVFSLSLGGGRLEKVAESLDFERNQYNSVEDSTKIIIDETRELGVGGQFNLDFKPIEQIELSGSASWLEDEKRVKLTENKDRDGERTRVHFQGKLRPWSGQFTDVSYKNEENRAVDFSADKRNKRQEFFVKAGQDFSKTFKLSGEAFMALKQDIYANGKQDRDQTQARYSLTLSGVPLAWLAASSTLQWFATQDLLIPAANSVASKDKNILSWKADLDYTFWTKYRVSQRYEVSVTEEDFYFTPDKNALSEEYVLVTTSNIPLGERIALDFEHEFRLRETGSFLPDPNSPGNPETFFKDSRSKTENLRLGMSYGYREYLTVSCRQELSRDVDFDYESKTYRLSPSGTLDFSMRFSQKFGGTGTLDAMLHHRSRFGSFVRESQRSLWLPTLSIGYTF